MAGKNKFFHTTSACGVLKAPVDDPELGSARTGVSAMAIYLSLYLSICPSVRLSVCAGAARTFALVLHCGRGELPSLELRLS